MADTGKKNTQLGLLVIAGLFLFILTLYLIGKNQHLFGSNFELRVRFSNVNGLLKGNNVRFSGIQAGTVHRIRIIDDTTIEVSLLIDKAMAPYIDRKAVAAIGTEGLIGNKVVNITPSRTKAPPVVEGDLLASRVVVDTDAMLETLQRTNDNIADISGQLKNTVRRIDGSAALWRLLGDEGIATSVRSSLDHIYRASVNADAVTADLRTVISHVRSGQGSAGSLLMDTTFATGLNQAMATIRAAGDKAADLADQLNRTVQVIDQNINNGKGTVNALLNDSVMAVRLNASIENIRLGTDAFHQDMEALKHNFLFRGYFRRQEKEARKAAEKAKSPAAMTTIR